MLQQQKLGDDPERQQIINDELRGRFEEKYAENWVLNTAGQQREIRIQVSNDIVGQLNEYSLTNRLFDNQYGSEEEMSRSAEQAESYDEVSVVVATTYNVQNIPDPETGEVNEDILYQYADLNSDTHIDFFRVLE